MVDQEDATAPPALYDHCVTVYRAMLGEAKTVVQLSHDTDEEIQLSDDPTTGSIVVYEGFLTRLVTVKLNLSVPYYTSVRKALINMGCIRQLKRGGGNSPSQWEMIQEPTLEAFNSSDTKAGKSGADKHSAAQQQIADLSRRLSDLEQQVSAVIDALAEQFGTEVKK
jgi:hypothetical protein